MIGRLAAEWISPKIDPPQIGPGLPEFEAFRHDVASDRHEFVDGRPQGITVLFDRFRLTKTRLLISTELERSRQRVLSGTLTPSLHLRLPPLRTGSQRARQ